MGCRTSRNEGQVGDLPYDDEILDDDVDPNSASAKIAARRASKGYSQTTERTANFEVAREESKASQVSDPLGAVGEDKDWDELDEDDPMPFRQVSMSAKILARKASKNKVNLGRRLSCGTEEVGWGETPIGVQQLGVKLTQHSAEMQRQRSSSAGPGRQVSSNSNATAGGFGRQISAGSPSDKVSSKRMRTECDQPVWISTIGEESEEDVTDATKKDTVTAEQVPAAVIGAGLDLRAAAVAPISACAAVAPISVAISNPCEPMDQIT